MIAHRGASGHAFENSSHALALALDMGCDGVEIDIHVTRDRQVVVHHDAHLVTGEAIAEIDLARVLSVPLHDDTPVPLLTEVLAQLTPHMDVYVEVKGLSAGSDDALLEVIDHAPNAGRVHVHAFDHRVIAALRRRRPTLSLGALSGSYPLDPVRPVIDAGATTLWQVHHLIDAALVDQCGRAGVNVIAWTVNSRADAERLAGLGVDGLCGNWPERLRPLAE